MRMDQALAWITAAVVAILGGSGFYFLMISKATSREEALLTAGATPSPTPLASSHH
ncbi:MAG: hypothetical protein RIQ81_385, partial [Pseudomonadota bacterium]